MKHISNNTDRSELMRMLLREEQAYKQAISDGKCFAEVKRLYLNVKIVKIQLQRWVNNTQWVDADWQ